MRIKEQISTLAEKNQKWLAILIDPDKFIIDGKVSALHLQALENHPPDVLLVGGSLMTSDAFEETIEILKQLNTTPVIIFPGESGQISDEADAILNLSLLSGRNPDFLIGQHVRSAFKLHRSSLEIIPTGYLLIDSGAPTSVSYISNTQPIPANKPEIVIATALAAQQMGKSLIYLEGGSGASEKINTKMIQAVSSYINIPLVVGGGIETTHDMTEVWNAGADIVVIGTAFENDYSLLNKIFNSLNPYENNSIQQQ